MSHNLAFKVGKLFVGNRTAKDVLRCLADYADDDGNNCFPGRETIVCETEINKCSFSSAIKYLENNGFISITRHQKNNKNIYRINVDKIESSTENHTTIDANTVVRKTVQQEKELYGKPVNSGTENRTTVVRKTVHDSVNTQSILSQNTYSSRQTSEIFSPEEQSKTDLFEDLPKENPEQQKKPKKIQAKVFHFPYKTIPEQWENYCKEAYPNLDPVKEFAACRFYFEAANGKDKMRSEKGWNSTWQNWLSRARPTENKSIISNLKNTERPRNEFANKNYRNGIAPNGRLL